MEASRKKGGNILFSVTDRAGRLLHRKLVPFLDGEPAMEALRKEVDIGTKPTKFGEQIVLVEGIQSEWFHFFVRQKGREKEGMPYVSLKGGRRAFIDLPNMRLTATHDGIEIRITVVSCCKDLPNSTENRIEGCYSDFSLQDIAQVKGMLGRAIADAMAIELRHSPHSLLNRFYWQPSMPAWRLRDYYVEKMLLGALRQRIASGAEGFAEMRLDGETQEGVELSFTINASYAEKPMGHEAPFAFSILHSSAVQGKKERAKVKELGQRATARDRDSVEALQEELCKKQQQLEPLLIANLERVRSSLDCPAGAFS